MSVYRAKDSPYYQYDFKMRGRRFHGTTKQTSKREAEKAERLKREEERNTSTRPVPQTRFASILIALPGATGRRLASTMPVPTIHGGSLKCCLTTLASISS